MQHSLDSYGALVLFGLRQLCGIFGSHVGGFFLGGFGFRRVSPWLTIGNSDIQGQLLISTCHDMC